MTSTAAPMLIHHHFAVDLDEPVGSAVEVVVVVVGPVVVDVVETDVEVVVEPRVVVERATVVDVVDVVEPVVAGDVVDVVCDPIVVVGRRMVSIEMARPA